MPTRTPKVVKKIVNLMTNPNPEFVSLVGHPANQTPFRAVKLDPNALERLSQVETQQEIAARANAVPCDVQSIKFDKTVFKSEESVRTYLDSRGWTDYSIVDEAKYFSIANRDAGDFEGAIEDISAQSGVTMSVGRVKKSSATPEPAKKVSPGAQPEVKEKSLEVAKKYDAWYASWSNGTTLKDVMASGCDGLPPGFYEITDAYITAICNNLMEGNEGGVRSLGDEFTDILLKLVSVFKHLTPEQVQKMTTKDTTGTATATGADATTNKDGAATATTTATTTEGAKGGETSTAVLPGTTEVVKETTTAPNANPNGTTQDASKTTTSDAEGLAETVTKSVLQAIGGTLTEAMKPVTEQLATQKTTLDKLEERLTAVEAGQSQTRKSASIEEVTQPGTAQPTEQDQEKAKRAAKREARERAGLLGY